MVYNFKKRSVRPRRPRRAFKRRATRVGRRKPLNNKTQVTAGLGFPKQMLMKHRYVENIVLQGVTGSSATYRFSANGLYDPNITGTGHQPLYFDQMATLYNHYCVIGSKITYQIQNNNSTYTLGVATFVNDDTSLTTSTIQALAEQSAGNVRLVSAAGRGPSKIFLTKKWSAKKMFPGSVLSNYDLSASITSNPAEQSYFDIMIQDPTSSVTVDANILVTIEYIAIWTELRDVAQS